MYVSWRGWRPGPDIGVPSRGRSFARSFAGLSRGVRRVVGVLLLLMGGGGARARNRDTSLSKNYRRPSRLVPGGTRFASPYGPRTECNGRRLTSAATCMIVATSSSGKYEDRVLLPFFRAVLRPPPDRKLELEAAKLLDVACRATSTRAARQKKRLLHREWSSVLERPRFQRSQRSKRRGKRRSAPFLKLTLAVDAGQYSPR